MILGDDEERRNDWISRFDEEVAGRATARDGHRVLRGATFSVRPLVRRVIEMHSEQDLERFVEAQDPVYGRVRAELAAGRKASHWMWFVFPQLRGLGRSETALFFGISSATEAAAYLAHPVLGGRLRECVELVLNVNDRTAHEIFGSPDDLKFRSSMTLFAAVSPADPLFQRALDRYFDGARDPLTVQKLQATG